MAIKPFVLPETEQKRLTELHPDIITIQQEINKAKRAGVDVRALQARLDRVKTLKEGILREYGSKQ